ncbi:TraU family protein [Geomonas subterranea]|uniref:TraU family protein n=1 Tax=Geomonas subterranea TaxID=2847989 RepID=UPI001CD3EBF5|nr:TraU family protein [Geomonas fuzhouensis]
MKYTNICRKALLLAISLLVLAQGQRAEAKCEGSPFNPVTDIAWNGIFPIRVGGVAVAQSKNMPDGADGTTDAICTCKTEKETFIGSEVSFHDLGILVEVVNDAYCSPTLGVQFSGLDNGSRAGINNKSIDSQRTFKQVHWYQFPVFHILGMLLDMKCIAQGSGLVPGDMSELDPSHTYDFIAALADPKVFLFANPAADIACGGKNVIAQVPGGFFPAAYDSLFWCQWDNIYPLSGNVGHSSHLTASAQLVAKQLYKFSQFGGILDYTANSCQGTYTPVMKSSQWRYQLAKPVKTATPFWAGQSELAWGSGKLPTYKDSNFLFVVFQKKKCCQKFKGAN